MLLWLVWTKIGLAAAAFPGGGVGKNLKRCMPALSGHRGNNVWVTDGMVRLRFQETNPEYVQFLLLDTKNLWLRNWAETNPN